MQLRISTLPVHLAICKLAPDALLPDWVRGAFVSITRTTEELSIICDDDVVPSEVRAERGWRAFKVDGPISFEVVGVAAALTAPMAEAGISVFLIATYDTDYLLVKDDTFDRAADALRRAGHVIA